MALKKVSVVIYTIRSTILTKSKKKAAFSSADHFRNSFKISSICPPSHLQKNRPEQIYPDDFFVLSPKSYADFGFAAAGRHFCNDDLFIDFFFQLGYVRNDTNQSFPFRQRRKRFHRLRKRFFVQRAETFVHKHRI